MKPKVNRPLLLCAILMTVIAVLSLWSPTKGDMIETNEMQVESPLGIDNYQPGMSLMAISGQKSWGSFAGELYGETLHMYIYMLIYMCVRWFDGIEKTHKTVRGRRVGACQNQRQSPPL